MIAWKTVANAVSALLVAVLQKISLIWLGKERQRRKQAEADLEVAKEHADIDNKPDVDNPFSRLRNDR